VPSTGGRDEALRKLDHFVRERLRGYADHRNREADRTSELSPYLHFGFLSVHEVARRALFSSAPAEDVDAFLEQLIIRRELSFNPCFYPAAPTSLSCPPQRAKKTPPLPRRPRGGQTSSGMTMTQTPNVGLYQ